MSGPAFGAPGLRVDRIGRSELSGRSSRGNETRAAVFDKGRTVSTDVELRFGLKGGGHNLVSFRITDADRRPAREVVTARLLGDPAPGRAMPTDEPVIAGRVCTESGPVLLTFREYREHYGEGV